MKIDYNVKTKIFVCYYHNCNKPKEDIFFPIQAGKAVSGFKINMQGDDTGDNISYKNKTFSEFTAWYWVWKNIKIIYPNLEYIGLSHYRHFFALNEPFDAYPIIFHDYIPKMENYENTIIEKLTNNDIIITKPIHYSLNLETQYGIRHNFTDYLHMKEILHEIYPEYDESWEYVFNNNIASWFCIFISKYELFNEYFEWLFPLLFEVEKRINVSDYNAYQKRAIAFLAERLFNVYIYHNKLKTCYEPMYFIKGLKEKKTFKKYLKLFIPFGIILLYKKIKRIINKRNE